MNPYPELNPYFNPRAGYYAQPIHAGVRGGSDWIGTVMLAGVVGAVVVGYLIYRNVGTSTYALRGAARALRGKD